MITSRGLSFSYPGGRRILSGIDFHIEKGESVALLGANGSGKSTLLGLISTLLPVTEGKLSVAGTIADSEMKRREIRRHIAYVFQNPDACFVSDTVLEDACFTPMNYGYSEKDAKDMALVSLEHYGILDKKDRLIDSLSGGEKERAILASVSALEKDLYIFDEVLTFLDGNARHTMLSLISQLKKDGKTIIFVTHDPDDALYFDRTMLLSDGKIAAFDETEKVLRDVDLLRSSGMRPCKATLIAQNLMKRGISLPFMPLGKEELCSLLGM